MTHSHLVRGLALALAVVALTGCPRPPDAMDSGLMTETDGGGTCEGQIGCACQTGGVCVTGECLGTTCVDCRRGEASCVCRSNGTCNAGLRCANARCETCPEQSQGCACGAGGTCGSGLTCTNDTCTPTMCTAGTVSCPCRASDPRCDTSLTCDGMGVCQTCMPDVAGCPCGAGNMCGGGLTCDVGTMRCRAPVTCVSLVMNGTCKLHQLCTEAPGMDAVCIANTCEANWKWDARTSDCVACLSPNCADEPTCTSDGGIGAMCASQFRECVSTGTPPITFCDACLPGYALNSTTMMCQAVPACGSVTCMANEYCDPTGGTPTCRTSPCALGSALDNGTCQPCALSCAGVVGSTGYLWPFKTLGQCLCATLPGYFLKSGGLGDPIACDSDGDGWVKEDADSSMDPQLRANSRCAIRRAETVVLRDELGVDLRLRSCVTGLVPEASAPACATLPLRLLETERNDVPGRATALTNAPEYGNADAGAPGRLLEARELNSLTKACVTELGDYNDNRVNDIAEAPANLPNLMPPRAPDRDRLEEFAYFVELHTSSFTGNDGGVLVIQERSRCTSTGFPIQYPYPDGGFVRLGGSNGDDYDARNAHSYWRSCARRRDPSLDLSRPGFDLARFNCEPDGGVSCGFVPPPHRMLTLPTDPGLELPRNHGVCEVRPNAPADGRWRGMNHHSQFKCVKAVPAGQVTTNGYDVDEARFQPAGDLAMNVCRAATGSPVRVQCIAPPGLPARLGFAAVKYRPYGPLASGYGFNQSYRGGCVNEDVETAVLPPVLPTYGTYLCPWPEFDNIYQSDGGMKLRSDRAFGRYSCFGDLPNFLWAPAVGGLPDGGFERATLRWADDAGSLMFGVLR
ncbi:MAG: hypothetical protein JNJ54_09985 [Myxococcaceae bacterium]|nr:hypothetical protein [Myxococcaceae bacterium]